MNCVAQSSNAFSANNSISISVNNSNFTSVVFKVVYHAIAEDERNFAGSI